MDKNQKHWLKNMVAWAEMKVSLEYPKAEYASFVEAVDALQIDLDNVDSQAARIHELEQALRGDKKTFPIATHNGLHIYSDADAVERKIISLEAELSAALEDARSLANFIDYHCVEDMPDALTREIVNKYTGTSDAALGK